MDVSEGMGLHSGWPFEVPLELGGRTVTACGGEARVTAHNAKRDARYEVCNRAGLESAGRGQGLLDEVEVTAEVAVNVVEEGAAVDQSGG